MALASWEIDVMDPHTALPAGKLPGGILSRLLAKFPIDDQRIVLGPGVGRDSAAIAFGDEMLIVKTDPITFATDRASYHLVHINANDIACQGGTPRWLLVTALLPDGATTPASVEAIFNELNEAARQIGVSVIGGHTEITGGLSRSILIGTMLGIVRREGLIYPMAAKPGDRILMTKTAGIEGTALLASESVARLTGLLEADLIARAANFLSFPGISILCEAAALHQTGAISAMHDPTEGGVATAIRELAEATGCGAVVSHAAITVAPETGLICETLGLDPLGLLSSGSLLATVPADRMDDVRLALEAVDVPFSWIGKLTSPGSGVKMNEDGHYVDLPEFAVDEIARLLTAPR